MDRLPLTATYATRACAHVQSEGARRGSRPPEQVLLKPMSLEASAGDPRVQQTHFSVDHP